MARRVAALGLVKTGVQRLGANEGGRREEENDPEVSNGQAV